MIRIGMAGTSEGNGHPYSFAAILNGYEPDAMARSPYPTIAEYLGRQPSGAFGIGDARVTHIWAPDRSQAEDVARTCRIRDVVADPTEMLTQIDAVILPYDDPATHLEVARPFLEAGLPVFIDKPLAGTMADARALVALAGKRGLLMSCSALRYAVETDRLREALPGLGAPTLVHGVSWRSWMKYGVHLVEALYALFGRGISEVRSLGRPDGVTVHCSYPRDPRVVLQVFERISPLIQLGVYGTAGYRMLDAADWFVMFKRTLAHFVTMVETGRPPIPLDETLEIVGVVLAGHRSLVLGGEPVAVADVGRS